MGELRYLSREEARTFYDRMGARQDRQAFYERPAQDLLLEQARFGDCKRVLEIGCGTGSFARRLLVAHLPPSASYVGLDLSPVMLLLAAEKMEDFSPSVGLFRTDVTTTLSFRSDCFDWLFSCYVLDLLSPADIHRTLSECARILRPGGRMGLVNLAPGDSPASRLLIRLWRWIFRVHPKWVGGCRPLSIEKHLDSRTWQIDFLQTQTTWAIPSSVAILRRKASYPA